jgi:putative transposase
MPRHARLRIGGLPLHVIQRGVNRSACFGDESDYGVYLALLEELSRRYECAMHAYVLMTNHVHLLLTPPEPDGVSKLMKHLGQRYVQYFNRKHKRTGSLWEGRFRSSLIDSEGYLMRCHRYIEMNPVRAGMVQRPSDYRWSSHGSNAHGAATHVTLIPHALYLALGASEEERREQYRSLFCDALTQEELEEIREAARGGFALGRPAFLASLERVLRRRVSHGVDGRPRIRTQA